MWSPNPVDPVERPLLGWAPDGGPPAPIPEELLGWSPVAHASGLLLSQATLFADAVYPPQDLARFAASAQFSVSGFPRNPAAAMLGGVVVLAAAGFPRLFASTQVGSQAVLSAAGDYPVMSEQTVVMSAGVNLIPWWAKKIDVVICGGGRGGSGGGWVITSRGGNPGVWQGFTINRALTAVPWTISFVIGAGGTRGTGGIITTRGDNGGDSIATWNGGSLTAAGGNTEASGITGIGNGNFTFNGKLYVGSTNTTSNGQNGNTPGGGAAGGGLSSNGGAGAAGIGYLRFYQ